MSALSHYDKFGLHCFDDRVMQERLPQEIYESLRKIRDEGMEWDPLVADVVADAMKDWALELGATHYIHWFTPMTGASAGKHESFIDKLRGGEPIVRFSGRLLSKGEPDASSFPTGGLRTTFEARGYTTWDPTSPAFMFGTTLYIPTAFCGYCGESLDEKTPLLRSMQALNKQSLRVLRALGDDTTKKVNSTAGAEQEYFLIEKSLLDKRLDLKICGYTLTGARPPKGQELEDHYYGSVSERVRNFMRELDEELWLIGVPAKTEHNEVAPGQYELANIFASANIACDHNQITMELMRKVALRHGFVCLLHEKPFAGVNGSGKHNNWSLMTSNGRNLLAPGDSPVENREFLVFLCAVIAAVDDYADLIRLSAACAGNDYRLGANEAPPAIVSIFLGDPLTQLLKNLAEGHAYEMGSRGQLLTGVKSLPLLEMDDNDRNRTSPFAYTGNKFEFRMVGSSQSIGFANTVINAAVADELRLFADILEPAAGSKKKTEAAVAKIVHDTWEKHKKILFNGNNYAPEWWAEAKKRKLPDISDTVQATKALQRTENVEMFERTRVLSPSECSSRREVLLEGYVKTTRIAAATLLDMTRRSFLPSACEWLSKMASAQVKADAADAGSTYVNKMTGYLSNAIDACGKAADELAQAMEELETLEDLDQLGETARSLVQNEMADLRLCCDTLETLLPEDRWPVPGYSALLYDV
ncbi:glutamine synthetase III [Ruminococcaceae bacterium OttesenSCG-928-I18]|nr:glutamine synthetase III [Ruminococcaceae bacterium OttesenSCG-928-I18]